MKNIRRNMVIAQSLAEQIGYEKIWDIDVSEYSVRILTYAGYGVADIVLSLGFQQVDETHYQKGDQNIGISKFFNK